MLMELVKSLCNSFLQKLVLASCGGVLFSLVGADTLAYEVVVILTVIDLITGVIVAFQKKELSSRKGFKTVYKLLLYFMLMIAAHQFGRFVTGFTILEYFIVAYIAGNEMLSLVENSIKLGIPIPIWIVQRLKDQLEKVPSKIN